MDGVTARRRSHVGLARLGPHRPFWHDSGFRPDSIFAKRAKNVPHIDRTEWLSAADPFSRSAMHGHGLVCRRPLHRWENLRLGRDDCDQQDTRSRWRNLRGTIGYCREHDVSLALCTVTRLTAYGVSTVAGRSPQSSSSGAFRPQQAEAPQADRPRW